MKRHAYLIIAHSQFEILMTQLRLLDHENNDFYIHIDKKSQNVPFDQIKNSVSASNIYFINRISVNWGGYSMVQCEINLLKAATKGHYDYYHLLSGVDLPIKTTTTILQFFENTNNIEYIHFDSNIISDKILQRIQTYYYFQEKERKNVVFYILNRICTRFQRFLKINRIKKSNIQFQYGAQWFSITHKFAEYVISRESWIKQYFKLSCCSDELFLQSLIINSPFETNLVSNAYSGKYTACLRYIDWNRGNPYVFRSADYDDLLNSPYLFARKFDLNVDSQIVKSIERTLKSQS